MASCEENSRSYSYSNFNGKTSELKKWNCMELSIAIFDYQKVHDSINILAKEIKQQVPRWKRHVFVKDGLCTA
jgi:hypothetical protein